MVKIETLTSFLHHHKSQSLVMSKFPMHKRSGHSDAQRSRWCRRCCRGQGEDVVDIWPHISAPLPQSVGYPDKFERKTNA
jgi:hypothetical protein